MAMQIFEQFYTIVVLIGLALFTTAKELRRNNFLKILLLLLVYSELIRLVTETNARQVSVFIIISACIARSLLTPGSYLHFRNQFFKSGFRKSDIVHLLPFAIFCIGLVINYVLNNNADFLRYYKLETSELSVASRMTVLCFIAYSYCVTGVYLCLTFRNFKKQNNMLYEPITEKNILANPEKKNEVVATFNHRSVILSKERTTEMCETIKEFLTEKKPFLQHKYSLVDLSRDTKISVHHLSAFINHYYGMNFNDFINLFRVEYCKEKILNDEGKYKKLEAIADESGFNNRNTFATAFKKVTGVNPSKFLKTNSTGVRA
jgi:AraC-like DNA-binding protein